MGGRCVAALLGAVALVAWAAPVAAQEPDLFMVHLGLSDVTDFDEETFEGRIEYSSSRKFYFIGPMAGLMVTGRRSVFAYAGLYFDVPLGDRIVVRTAGAVGAFSRGQAKNLGGVMEFHAGLTLAYVFENRARLGVTVTHISHAGLNGSNPGVDSALLTYAIPIGPFF